MADAVKGTDGATGSGAAGAVDDEDTLVREECSEEVCSAGGNSPACGVRPLVGKLDAGWVAAALGIAGGSPPTTADCAAEQLVPPARACVAGSGAAGGATVMGSAGLGTVGTEGAGSVGLVPLSACGTPALSDDALWDNPVIGVPPSGVGGVPGTLGHGRGGAGCSDVWQPEMLAEGSVAERLPASRAGFGAGGIED